MVANLYGTWDDDDDFDTVLAFLNEIASKQNTLTLYRDKELIVSELNNVGKPAPLNLGNGYAQPGLITTVTTLPKIMGSNWQSLIASKQT
jgi:hypothetical protein